MAFRFRRTIKIAPGVRLNLTKKGISARLGPRGLGVTTGTSGTTVSAGIPGSGLHFSQKINNQTVASTQEVSAEVKSFEKPSTQGLGMWGWFGVAAIGVGILWLIS